MDSVVLNKHIRDSRILCVKQFFLSWLKRNPTDEELFYYVDCGDPLDVIYTNIVFSNPLGGNKGKLPISLVIFTKNSSGFINMPIESVSNYVSEIVVVDTGSTDDTVEVCKKFTDRVYKVGFTDFGSIRTLSSHLASEEWVLGLDSDEVLTNPENLIELITTPGVDVWGLPRRRWSDIERTVQVEFSAYPDTQWRLFKNDLSYGYKGRVHESFYGTSNKKKTDLVHIEHYQDVFKSGDKLKKRNLWYKELYDLDVSEGREFNISPVSDIDDV